MDKIVPNYIDIVDIAKHCDNRKLKIAENLAKQYDVFEMFCEIEDFAENKPADDPIYIGGENFGGLNKIFGFLSYSRYVENSIYVDTAAGFVRKDHGNSFPISHAEIKDVARQHRKIANTEFERLKSYVCKQQTNSRCVCDGSICGKKTNTTLTDSKSYNISKLRIGRF